jgi:hypothetical protein
MQFVECHAGILLREFQGPQCGVDAHAESFRSVPQGGRCLFDRQDGRFDIRAGRIGSQ